MNACPWAGASRRRAAGLLAVDVHRALLEVDVRPAKRERFGDAIATLNLFRDTLEELDDGNVTDPVSGPVVLELK